MSDERFKREAAGRKAYDLFASHYLRMYGASLPTYDQLGSQSQEVWNATAAELAKGDDRCALNT